MSLTNTTKLLVGALLALTSYHAPSVEVDGVCLGLICPGMVRNRRASRSPVTVRNASSPGAPKSPAQKKKKKIRRDRVD